MKRCKPTMGRRGLKALARKCRSRRRTVRASSRQRCRRAAETFARLRGLRLAVCGDGDAFAAPGGIAFDHQRQAQNVHAAFQRRVIGRRQHARDRHAGPRRFGNEIWRA